MAFCPNLIAQLSKAREDASEAAKSTAAEANKRLSASYTRCV
jgi:hypothetical protein